jgi:hypothetical protein
MYHYTTWRLKKDPSGERTEIGRSVEASFLIAASVERYEPVGPQKALRGAAIEETVRAVWLRMSITGERRGASPSPKGREEGSLKPNGSMSNQAGERSGRPGTLMLLWRFWKNSHRSGAKGRRENSASVAGTSAGGRPSGERLPVRTVAGSDGGKHPVPVSATFMPS